jgi:hypothetical protein
MNDKTNRERPRPWGLWSGFALIALGPVLAWLLGGLGFLGGHASTHGDSVPPELKARALSASIEGMFAAPIVLAIVSGAGVVVVVLSLVAQSRRRAEPRTTG